MSVTQFDSWEGGRPGTASLRMLLMALAAKCLALGFGFDCWCCCARKNWRDREARTLKLCEGPKLSLDSWTLTWRHIMNK